MKNLEHMNYPKSKSKNLTYTYTSHPFGGVVVVDPKNFKKKIALNSPAYYQTFINTQTKLGDKVSIVITNKKPKRTEAQNRYWWGVYLPEISREKGGTPFELNEWVKHYVLPHKKVFVMGEWVEVIPSTTDLTVGEFITMIAEVFERTEVVPPPTEDYDLPKMIYPQKNLGEAEDAVIE